MAAVKAVALFMLLANWAVLCGIEMNKLTMLMKILHRFHPEFPLDTRTLLRSKGKSEVINRGMGHFYYLGVLTGILRATSCWPV